MAQNSDPHDPSDDPDGPATPPAPITSRFLFVDVAAQRAKQLRRGAVVRLERSASTPHKLERVAMDEVRHGLIHYTLPTVDDVQKGRGRE